MAYLPSKRDDQSIFSQAIINGNMQVSQRGNFTTAITSASGLASDRFYLDRWKTLFAGSSLANASLQRSTATIIGYAELTNAQKLIGNTSGSPITGSCRLNQIIEDFSVFKGKTVSMSFWARSNLSTKFMAWMSDGVTESGSELNTNSGDGVWRHYTVTKTLSASATALNCLFAIVDTDFGSQVSIPAGGYIEFTGVRLYEGTDELPALVRSYDDELQKCLRYCFAQDGERAYNSGYSIYNISGVARATWQSGSGGQEAGAYCAESITDVGVVGAVSVPHTHPMKGQSNPNSTYFMFDLANPTNGGQAAASRVTVTDVSGAQTHNVSLSSASFIDTVFIFNLSGVVTGHAKAHYCVSAEIF